MLPVAFAAEYQASDISTGGIATGTGRNSRAKDLACASTKLRGSTAMRSEWATSGRASENDVTTRVTRRDSLASEKVVDDAPVRHPQRRDEDVLQLGEPLHRPALGRERMSLAQDADKVLDEEALRPQVPILEDLGNDRDPTRSRRNAPTSTVTVLIDSRAPGARSPRRRSSAGTSNTATRSDVVRMISHDAVAGSNGWPCSNSRSAASMTSFTACAARRLVACARAPCPIGRGADRRSRRASGAAHCSRPAGVMPSLRAARVTLASSSRWCSARA